MVFIRALSWVLSSTSYTRRTFQLYSLNTPQLGTSMLTMYRRLSMVHPLLSLFLLAVLMLSLSRDLHLWMSSNRLSLNPNEMQFIWFGTRQQPLKLDFPLLAERFPFFTFHCSLRDLGVVLDSTLTL